MVLTILMILLILFVPMLMTRLAEKVTFLGKLGSVFLSYAAGIILSFPMKAMGAQLGLASDVSSVLVCIAMPLILFSADLLSLRSLAKPMLTSFLLNAVAVVMTSLISFFIFKNAVAGMEKVSAMLIGTYTGGTPNMFAIGHGMGASSEQLLMVQTSDMIAGGIYFFCLVSFMPRLLKKFMPEYRYVDPSKSLNADEHPVYGRKQGKPGLKNYIFGVGLAVLCAAAAMGICILIPSKFGNAGLAKLGEHTAIIMLLVTTFGIALSFVKKVRRCPGTYYAGQYCILMFSVAMGLCFDVKAVSGASLIIFASLMVIQFSTVILHFILAKLCRIDYHTATITSTAGIFGPAFIIPVAKALKNDEIILPGIICGIFGYAIGNYLGLGFGALLTMLG